MKKVFSVFLLFLAVFTTLTYAQPSKDSSPAANEKTEESGKKDDDAPSALSVYEKWKTDTLTSLAKAADTPHSALSVVTQRIDEQTAQLEYVVAGKMEKYTLEVTPIVVTLVANQEPKQVDAGKITVFDPRLKDEKQSKQQLGLSTTFIRLEKQANALRIVVKMKDNGKEVSYATVVPLRQAATVVASGFVN